MTDHDAPDEPDGSCAPPIPKLMSISAVAVTFGRSERTVSRWIAQGVLNPVRVGRSTFIRAEEVHSIISGSMSDRILRGR